MQLLKGKDVSSVIRGEIQKQVIQFQKDHGTKPCLAVVLVGEDPASHVYVRNKEKACAEVGIVSKKVNFPQDVPAQEVYDCIEKLNEDPQVHGILVQVPLPLQVKESEVLKRIRPLKDADGFTYENIGLMCSQKSRVKPCTPHGVIRILEHYNISMSGKKAVVIGRSQIVGRPMAELLMQENATVTICHSRTSNTQELTQQADIVVVAAGKPELFGKDYFKKDAVVIDVGIHRKENGKLCGDVNPEGLDGYLSALSPVPGGVGPMTITMLLENTLILAKLQMR